MKMNITQLEYFIMIIESNFNLSLAAEKLHISQPALSNLIMRFESSENVELFIRKNGRLVSLTNAGEALYSKSKQIVAIYKDMMAEINALSHYQGGVIRIGIPPLVISVLFTEFLSQLIGLNSNIKFEIMEQGAHKLVEEIEAEKIDIAIILQPNKVNLKEFHEVVLFEDKLSAYISEGHPLAKNRDYLTWEEIAEGPMVLFDKQYMIHHLIMDKFKQLNVSPNIAIESSSWDMLVAMARQTHVISVLPRPAKDFTNVDNIITLPIQDPIPWKVSMIYPIKDRYSMLEDYIIHTISAYFRDKQTIPSFEEFEDGL